MTPPSISMLIEAIARRDADPLTRFVRSLPDDEPFRLRSYAEETIRLQHEFLSNAPAHAHSDGAARGDLVRGMGLEARP